MPKDIHKRNKKIQEQEDILDIDMKIQKKFLEEQNHLPQHYARLAELVRTSNSKVSIRAKNDLMKSINELRDLISKIESKEELNFYIVDTIDILERYKQILKTPMKASFIGKSKQDDKEKNKLINQYMEIAQKYYPVVHIKPENKCNNACESCGNKKDFIIEDNSSICQECGSQQDIVPFMCSYKDSDRVNVSTKYTYDRKVHFRDCINQYQAKQNCTINQKIYDDLEQAFDNHHLLLGKKGDKKEERFAKITKEHVLMFLKELDYHKHYENVTLIHYNLTGKKPDDISHLEDVLLSDFDLLVETYDKMFKNKVDRVNFISSQYVLYQLLQRYKHPCKKEDFVILKTMDRKAFHDFVYKELSQALGWNMIPFY